ncbi:MAG: hypothetical protein E7571_03795 [Ruminococcaceae bacterium]|nr:hypothetical protein [Oscillospiraceae bacterium]
MISANDLRNVKLTKNGDGYSVEEVNATINAAADTIDAYVNENKELYRKMELLASKIEEYREEEDSIKAALITAEKMADQIKRESTEKAEKLITESEETANTTVSEANEKAEKLVSEARDYAASIVKEKTDEANAITADAEKKANDAINSSKIVAQNILDQAKEISDDLIGKSKEEKEAYEALNASLKENAREFIANVSALYIRQLETLKNAKLEVEKNDENKVAEIQKEVDSLVNEMDEMEEAIPSAVTVDSAEVNSQEAPASDDEEETITVETTVADEPSAEEAAPQTPAADDDFEIITDDEEEEEPVNTAEAVEAFSEEEEEPQDPMAAVEAFSRNTVSPIDTSSFGVPEIVEDAQMESTKDEEKSLFDDEGELPFESYFNVKKEDVHGDRTQTISLVPPEDDEKNETPKFKGFFGKKR